MDGQRHYSSTNTRRELFPLNDSNLTINTSHSGVPFIRGKVKKRSFGVIAFSKSSLISFISCAEINDIGELLEDPTMLYNSAKVCAVRKRYGFAFLDIICNKYRYSDIPRLVENLSQRERDMLSSMSIHAIKKTMNLGYRDLSGSQRYDIDAIRTEIMNAGPPNERELWEFPKGHKNPYEGAMEAAMRELEEETALEPCRIQLLSDVPMMYTYEGTNGSVYTISYYIGTYDDTDQIDRESNSSESGPQMIYKVRKKYLRLSGDESRVHPSRSASLPDKIFSTIENDEIDRVKWLNIDQAKSSMSDGYIDCLLVALETLISSRLFCDMIDKGKKKI